MNAKITSTQLGIEDHGCFTWMLFLDLADGCGCGFGGWCLDHYDKRLDKRICGEGATAILEILNVIGVENWEDLKGQYCRVEMTEDGCSIKAIGNIIKDKWFNPKELFKAFGWGE